MVNLIGEVEILFRKCIFELHGQKHATLTTIEGVVKNKIRRSHRVLVEMLFLLATR